MGYWEGRKRGEFSSFPAPLAHPLVKFLPFCPPTGDESDIIRRHSFENLARFIHWEWSVLVPSKGRSTKSADMAKLEPMMRLVLHCIDRVRRFRLGKEVC